MFIHCHNLYSLLVILLWLFLHCPNLCCLLVILLSCSFIVITSALCWWYYCHCSHYIKWYLHPVEHQTVSSTWIYFEFRWNKLHESWGFSWMWHCIRVNGSSCCWAFQPAFGFTYPLTQCLSTWKSGFEYRTTQCCISEEQNPHIDLYKNLKIH